MMELKQVKEVMKKYGRAWENKDTDLLLECFAEDGIYQESPLSKPIRGKQEIRQFWEQAVVKDTKDIEFTLKDCYVSKDGKTGFAEWECKNTHKWRKDGKWRRGHMAGIMLLKLKGGKISHLNEYWNTKT